MTNGHDILSESALGLLGISAATGLGAAVVGSTKRSEAKSTSEALNQEKSGLMATLSQPKAQSEGNPSVSDVGDTEKEKAKKKMRIEQIEVELRSLKSISKSREAPGFLNDILKDKDGITLHRFQIVVWTIVLGVIFLREVLISVAMPEFSGTLLALMGISGGTYIGFKFPEKNVK